MTLNYVPKWGPWDVVREIVTNAMDVDPNFVLKLNNDGALVVKSEGGDLAIRHLLFGMTEKLAENAIGEFGEGVKLALLVLTRMGLTAHIYSGGRHIWNEPYRLEGVDVFRLVWENYPKAASGTVVGVPDWPHGTFRERFVRPGDTRIVHTDQFGRYIMEEDAPNLYVKGVWVQGAESYGKYYALSYNLCEVTMNRDRRVVNNWRANLEIGKIWASVTNQELLERFWQAVKDGSGEHDCSMHGIQISSPPAMKRAIQAVYGTDAVVETNAAVAREATYRGASVIGRHEMGCTSLADLAGDLVGTDAEHVATMEGSERVHLPDGKLGDKQRKVLRMLRRLAARIGMDSKVMAYVLPDNVVGEASNDDIRVSVTQLGRAEDAIATWLHEQAHLAHDTADATAEMADAVAKIAARVIATYATR